jgi:hypothetical protein
MLVLASQQLQLAGNVRGALAALQAADQRLARARSSPRRRCGARSRRTWTAEGRPAGGHRGPRREDRQADRAGRHAAAAHRRDAAAARVRACKPRDEQGFARAARDLWEEMKGLVRIRELETPDAALLAPRRPTSCART